MAKLRLYWVREEGDESARLASEPSAAYVECKAVKSLADLDSYDIADYLDQCAENENRHEFVGANAAIAKLIRQQATEVDADAVMLAILKAGGLWKLAR